MGSRNRWFSVRVIVEIKLPRDSAKERTYDDRILVVRAASELAARGKAEEFARAEEASYPNAEGKIFGGASRRWSRPASFSPTT